MAAPFTRDSAYDAHKTTTFRQRISRDAASLHPPEAGRYHLYAMIGCPWAHRTLIVRELKGLQHAISVSFVHHRMVEEEGWAFGTDTPDPLYGLRHLREVYAMADPQFRGRPTVPVLWDKRRKTIVNNESGEIMRMLGREFDALARHPALDLCPPLLRPAIDAWNDRLQRDVNHGIYRAGFATTQAEHDEAATRFFAALALVDRHLASHRFLVGDEPTEADWRLFPTLIRFEWVYRTLFGCNARSLADHPRLLAYTRKLYRWPGIAPTLNEALTREAYFSSMRRLNPSGRVPPRSGADFEVVADVQEKRGA